MALAASAWVTTEQELKLAVAAEVIVVDDDDDGDDGDGEEAERFVVGDALVEVGDHEGAELQAASRMAVGTASTTPVRPL